MISTGMGGIIILKLIYKRVKYELCEGFDVNNKFEFYYNNKLFDVYSKVYITDLHLNKKNLDIINNDNKLKHKLILFDHNESVTEFNSYDFVNIIIKDKKGYCCSTSLLYEYLLNNNKIKRTNALDIFCEATRIFDTGIWNVDKDDIARDLSLLFDAIGPDDYIEKMYNKLKVERDFSFYNNELKLIDLKRKATDNEVVSYIKKIRLKKIYGHKAGIIYISYEFRNEIAQYLRENKLYDIDFIVLVAVDNYSISIRNINPNVNVRLIAEKIGGKGHFGAAGCNIDENNLDEITKILS